MEIHALDDIPGPGAGLTGGVGLRRLRMSDMEPMSKAGNNPKITRWMRNTFPSPYTLESARNFIEHCQDVDKWAPRSIASVPTTLSPAEAAQKVPAHYAITMDDVYIGACGLTFEGDVCERTAIFGYWIAEEYWGKGIVTAVAKTFLDWTWTAMPYLLRLDAGVFSGNEASQRVLAKCGFHQENVYKAKIWKNGEVLDLHVWALLRPGVQNLGAGA